MEFTTKKPNKALEILLVFLIVFLALFFRRHDAFTNPQLWAEDGPIFLQQYESFGVKSLIIPYAGYLHMVPRLIAFIFGALSVNLAYIPLCYNATVFLIVFLLAVHFWNSAASLGLNNRVAYATFFVIVPVGGDLFMNITNINGIASLYLINFLFTRYTGRYNIVNLLIIFIVSLSGPTSTLLSPIVLLVIIYERKELSFIKLLPLIFIMTGGVIQFIYIKFIDVGFYRGVPGSPEHLHFLRFFTNNTANLAFLDYGFMPKMSPLTKTLLSLLIFVILFFEFVACYLNIANKRKYVLLLACIICLASFINAYWPNESRALALEGAGRYYLVPYTCIGWILIVALDKKLKLVYLVAYAVFFVLQHRYTKFSLPDKQWKEQISNYYQGKTDSIAINPDGWHFNLPKKK